MFRLPAISRAAIRGSLHRAAYSTSGPRTLFDKIWSSHIVHQNPDGTSLLYIDRHLVHEVTSPQAFESLRLNGRKVRRPNLTLAVADHNVPTSDRAKGITNEESRIQVETLEENVRDFGVPYFPMSDIRQGVVHIIGPEQGFTQPGMTIVCGDSHTATHGAFGALAFGIGTSEVEHVLSTQTLWQKPAKSMRIAVDGSLPLGVTSKDVVLHIIGLIGTAGGTGYVIEYAGEVVRKLSMEARMTICNMSIEAGARAGMIAPDDITFNYIKGRPMAPKGEMWDRALSYWKSLPSDAGAKYDSEVLIKAESIAPQITWGTSPQDVIPVTGTVPDPAKEKDPARQATIKRALDYMGLKAGQPIAGTPIDVVFIGSCTNGRLEDIRAVVEVAKGHKVAAGVHAMVVPGSGLVKQQAEKEGLDKILKEAGFDWREPGCSMCLAMNADQLKPKQRSASTSNRNFEGRQGREGRTHLVSPAMAAAAAIAGKLTDVRTIQKRGFSTSHRMFSSKPNPMAFTTLKGTAAPLEITNCDTDMIIPKQFLKTIKRTGLGKNLFDEMRYTQAGAEKPEFVLNQAPYRAAKILVAGDNFGCGSSREHAPWAIADFGIKCVISTSFADIFYSNCFKNGILPVTVTKEQLEKLMSDAKAVKDLAIDLDKQTIVRPNGETINFTIDPYRKHCLYNGLDDVALTLQLDKEIAAFEEKRTKATPWL